MTNSGEESAELEWLRNSGIERCATTLNAIKQAKTIETAIFVAQISDMQFGL
jgi:hypothetical protein